MKSILITNDDGIAAKGLAVLCEALKGMGAVTVVAPEGEQSAASHSITLAKPICAAKRALDGGLEGWAVAGTPADCVKLAICEILDRRPDMVLSGINLGSNTGISILYSGTVAAASEAAIVGIPAAAVSLAGCQNPSWETAARAARGIVRLITAGCLPPGALLNVNVPNIPPEKVKGYAVAKMGQSRFVELFDRRVNPRGEVYYWLDGELRILGEAGGTDIQALEQGYISVTPIGIDRTRHDLLAQLEKWRWEDETR